MSFLQHTTLLPSTKHHGSSKTVSSLVSAGKEQHGHQSLRSKSSLATLVQLVRNPIEAVGEWGWSDESGQEARVRKQRVEDQKHILYLRLGDVRSSN